MSDEERRRQATYNYFNRRYRRYSESDDPEKKPLWKVMPEFFFGIFIVFIYLLEWANAAYYRSKNNLTERPSMESHDHVYRNMSYKRRL